jgi:hypothetical protein
MDPVGGRGVLVEPVRIGLGHRRREVSVADRPVGAGLPPEIEVGGVVVPDGELVVLPGPEPAVVPAVVVLDPAALIGVVRVRVAAALEIGKMVRRVGMPYRSV